MTPLTKIAIIIAGYGVFSFQIDFLFTDDVVQNDIQAGMFLVATGVLTGTMLMLLSTKIEDDNIADTFLTIAYFLSGFTSIVMGLQGFVHITSHLLFLMNEQGVTELGIFLLFITGAALIRTISMIINRLNPENYHPTGD